jgi:hypothetical protein
MREKSSIPLLKEHRISKLVEALKCIDKYSYDREKQRTCILKLYPGKTEKSVFRGMVIPTLRYLGLIIGFGRAIRPSGNGKIIVEAERKGKEEAIRVARVIFLEIDKRMFKFIEELKKYKNTTKRDLINLLSQKMKEISEKQENERINRWLNILEECKLVRFDRGLIKLDEENYKRAESELNLLPSLSSFKEILFEVYRSLPLNETAGMVDIPFLRMQVAISYYKRHNIILTESKFDKLLGSLPLVTDEYIISLGQPMGAEEKLFHYKGNYYRTLSITFFKKVDKYG